MAQPPTATSGGASIAQLHCPLIRLAVLPPPMMRFALFWHSKLPRTLLPTTSTGPVLSSTDMLPPTELSNISAELELSTASRLPPTVLPAQNRGAVDPTWTAVPSFLSSMLP